MEYCRLLIETSSAVFKEFNCCYKRRIRTTNFLLEWTNIPENNFRRLLKTFHFFYMLFSQELATIVEQFIG